MTKWHRTRRGDLGLRAMGLGICALSCAAIAQLLRLHDADPVHWTPGFAGYLLTAVGFVCASAGSGMVALGSHLFDEIVISERWRVKPAVDDPEVAGAADRRSIASVGMSSEASAPRPTIGDRHAVSREAASLFLRRSTATLHRAQDDAQIAPLAPTIPATLAGQRGRR